MNYGESSRPIETGAISGIARNDTAAPACQAPSAEVRHPRTPLPANTCDSHLHILGPAREYAYSSERVYTPPDCLLEDYARVRDYLGVKRCVIVQPSVYGSDNRVLLSALQELGSQARGVVVLSGRETKGELARMHMLGVRGVRVNLVDVKSVRPDLPREQLDRVAEMIRPMGWHLELLMHVDEYPEMESTLGDLEVQIVFGHAGYLSRQVKDIRHSGMQAMLSLMKSGCAWAKVTAPYRVADSPDYSKAGQIVRWLATECPSRLVWGTDWPHVMVKGAMPHDADLSDAVNEWIPDRDQRTAIFADNAARLYGWP